MLSHLPTHLSRGIKPFGNGVLVVTSALAAEQQPRREPDPRSMGGGDCRDNPYNCKDAPNPLPPASTVWLEEMTWMDVRDALTAGRTTAIVPTGGIEPNGPWLVLGKHNYVLRTNCDVIARKLGNALCAPILPLVPEGRIEPPSGHMRSPGTISLREETFQAVLEDVVRSLRAHGFQSVILIGDSGGNQAGQKAVAEKLNTEWQGSPVVAHIGEYYTAPPGTPNVLRQLGVVKDGQVDDGLHDSPGITLNMMLTDPASVRWAERVTAGKATINGVSIENKERALAWAKQIVDARAERTAALIRTAIASTAPQTLASPYARSMFAAYLYQPEPRRVLIVGLGGGAMVRFLAHHTPDVGVDAVEIDPVVVRLADQYFGVRSGGNVRVITADAVAFVEAIDEPYDVIFMDAFLRPSGDTDGTGVPTRLKTIEFLGRVKRALTPGGVVAFNINQHAGVADDIAAVAEVFGQVAIYGAAPADNDVVIATDGAMPGDAVLTARIGALDQRFRGALSFAGCCRTVLSGASSTSACFRNVAPMKLETPGCVNRPGFALAHSRSAAMLAGGALT